MISLSPTPLPTQRTKAQEMNIHTSMPSTGFGPAIPAKKLLQTFFTSQTALPPGSASMYINTQLILSSRLKDESRISRLWLYSPYVTVAINYGLVLCLTLLRHEPPNSFTRLFINIRQTVLCHSRDQQQQQLVTHIIMLCDFGDQWQVS